MKLINSKYVLITKTYKSGTKFQIRSIWDEGGKISEGNKNLPKFFFFCLGIEVEKK